jgi:hypothetical protein
VLVFGSALIEGPAGSDILIGKKKKYSSKILCLD